MTRWRGLVRWCGAAVLAMMLTPGCIDREIVVADSGTDAVAGSDSAGGATDGGVTDSGPMVANGCGGFSLLPDLASTCAPCRIVACAGPDETRCAYDPGPGCPAFEDVTIAAGLSLPAAGVIDWGPGVGVGDLDGDGALDIVHSGAWATNVFLADPLTGPASFVLAADSLGVSDARTGNAAVPLDVDGDGDLDLTITGKKTLTLWRNDGGAFVDITAASNLQVSEGANGVAWGDYDADGDLDVYVASFEQTDASHLLRNDGGTFTDVTASAGVELPGARSFQPVWVDYDLDGDLDLMVANDIPHVTSVPMALFANAGDGTFSEVGVAAGIAYFIDGMGIAVGDPDRDGDPDVFLTNVPGVPSFGINTLLFMNDGNGSYREEAVARGAGVARYSWGTVFLDYDNDGFEDLFVAAEPWGGAPAIGCVLLRNDGMSAFDDVSVGSGADIQSDAFGAVATDIDDDGDMDLVLTGRGAGPPVMLLLNNGNPGRWLKVRLEDGSVNRDGIGATIQVHVGGETQTRWLRAGESMHSGAPPEVHFGMGWAPRADAVVVTWPDGTTTELTDVALDRTLVVTRP